MTALARTRYARMQRQPARRTRRAGRNRNPFFFQKMERASVWRFAPNQPTFPEVEFRNRSMD